MKLFKEKLVDAVNPDLLERLWIKKGMPDVLEYQSIYGFTLYKTAMPFGICILSVYNPEEFSIFKEIAREQTLSN